MSVGRSICITSLRAPRWRWPCGSVAALEACGHREWLPSSVSIITGWGKSLERRKSSAAFADDDRRGYRSFLDELALCGERSSVRRSVLEALRLCKVPTIAPEENGGSSNPGLVELDTQLLGRWAKAAIASGLIRGYFEVDDRLILGLSEEQARVIERAGRGA